MDGNILMQGSLELNKIYCCNALDLMARMPDGFVDLTVTSPPYDNLRSYNGYEFDFETIARELYRVTKKGGVVVWVVGDATVNGSETLTSLSNAARFKTHGFWLYDTMIYEKASRIPTEGRYYNVFEYMFVFSKGKPKTINFINDHRNVTFGAVKQKDAVINKGANVKKDAFLITPEFSRRSNIWRYGTGTNDPTDHPAVFPEQLALDHVQSWSNEGDVVYDPFMGSGTTGKAAHQLKRRWIGSEISQEYVDLANKRLEPYLAQESLF